MYPKRKFFWNILLCRRLSVITSQVAWSEALLKIFRLINPFCSASRFLIQPIHFAATTYQEEQPRSEWYYKVVVVVHGVVVCALRTRLIIFLVFTFRGQASVHFPHSMHFDASAMASFALPLRIWWHITLKLNLVNCPAVQVALQLPQLMHSANEGSCSVRCLARFTLALSKSVMLATRGVNPKSIMGLAA